MQLDQCLELQLFYRLVKWICSGFIQEDRVARVEGRIWRAAPVVNSTCLSARHRVRGKCFVELSSCCCCCCHPSGHTWDPGSTGFAGQNTNINVVKVVYFYYYGFSNWSDLILPENISQNKELSFIYSLTQLMHSFKQRWKNLGVQHIIKPRRNVSRTFLSARWSKMSSRTFLRGVLLYAKAFPPPLSNINIRFLN